MPIVKHLAVLVLERAPVWHGMLGFEARHPEPARTVLACEDRVRPTGPVRIALPRHVEYRSYTCVCESAKKERKKGESQREENEDDEDDDEGDSYP
jgi:hypothetical protein